MKITKLKTKKQLLFELFLKKFQTYKTDSFSKAELKFKQVLHIISDYHLNKKKILFIGMPYSTNYLLLKYSKHTFVPKRLLTKYLNNTRKLKNINLIVFFNFQIDDLILLKELQFVKKPLVVIGKDVFTKNKNISDYFVRINLTVKHLKQFCAFIIYSIIKK